MHARLAFANDHERSVIEVSRRKTLYLSGDLGILVPGATASVMLLEVLVT